MARTVAKADRSLRQITEQQEKLDQERTELEAEQRDLLARMSLDNERLAGARLRKVKARLAEIEVEKGDLGVQQEVVTEERERLAAIEREKTAEAWQKRLAELTEAKEGTEKVVAAKIEELADAIADLRDACTAPLIEAGKYGRETRAFPFRPGTIKDEIGRAIYRRGVKGFRAGT